MIEVESHPVTGKDQLPFGVTAHCILFEFFKNFCYNIYIVRKENELKNFTSGGLYYEK